MSDTSSSHDEITVAADDSKGQGLKYLPHWPPVNIDFEDVIYTIPNGIESKFLFISVRLNFYCPVQLSRFSAPRSGADLLTSRLEAFTILRAKPGIKMQSLWCLFLDDSEKPFISSYFLVFCGFVIRDKHKKQKNLQILWLFSLATEKFARCDETPETEEFN